MLLASLLSLYFFATPSCSQLIGPVGPTTSLAQKTNECSILQYGGVAGGKTDVGNAITSAFQNCVKKTPGSRLVVPSGNYSLQQSITLSGGVDWAFQLDGLITADYLGSSSKYTQNFITIPNAVNFEFYSSNGLGAIQGNGYHYRINNDNFQPRMLRLLAPVNASVHDVLLIDSPKFSLIFENAVNVEVYHVTIRAANLGGYDGIDISGTNYHVHDNEVTNRDECLAVKNPSNHVLIENQVCNRVGSGVSIGSLNVSTQISNILVRNISVVAGNEISFIKSYPGGSGYVTNVTFENFRSISSTYGCSVNEYWQGKTSPDNSGVAISNVLFKNFTGTVVNGAQRPILNLIASNAVPAVNVTVEDFSVWTDSGNSIVNHISNVYGTGDNVYGPSNGIRELNKGGKPTVFSTDIKITATPTGFVRPTNPAWAAPSDGWGTTDPIPVYTPAALWKAQGDYEKHYWGTF